MKYLKSLMFVLLPLSTQAQTITCPPPETVLQQKMVKPLQNPYDEDQWNFRSQTFISNGQSWFVEFGSFFPGHLDRNEALRQGQAYYDKIMLKISNPTPYKIDNVYLCNYMPEGGDYWVSALTG